MTRPILIVLLLALLPCLIPAAPVKEISLFEKLTDTNLKSEDALSDLFMIILLGLFIFAIVIGILFILCMICCPCCTAPICFCCGCLGFLCCRATAEELLMGDDD